MTAQSSTSSVSARQRPRVFFVSGKISGFWTYIGSWSVFVAFGAVSSWRLGPRAQTRFVGGVGAWTVGGGRCLVAFGAGPKRGLLVALGLGLLVGAVSCGVW